MNEPGTPFPDIRKILEQLKLPGIDINVILEAQRKDIEALTLANQHAYESMQTLARRQTEILQQSVAEWQNAMSSMTGKSPAEAATVGVDLAKRAVHGALTNMVDLAEMAAKTQAQAMETANRRFQENLEQLRRMLQPK